MKVNFPSFNEYQAVLQSPLHCFNAPELKASAIETDLWGLPRVRSGGFALTYKLTNQARAFAVRCFHRHVPDRTSRYAAISSFLMANPSDVLVPIRYQTNGVLVHGKWFPITYMKWVEGDTLEAFVVKNVHNQALIHSLSGELLRVSAEFERLRIAHGDLSHRNILVKNGKMILVDYDGMFVPELQGKKSCEIGNPHFQLPSRSEAHFNADLDRFSEIVIYLALEALSRNPTLWDLYETGGEGLLFQREDLVAPYQSALLQEIETLPGLKPLVDQFRHICTSQLELVPRLADFLEAKPLDLTRSEQPLEPAPPPPVLDASLRIQLLSKVGKVVTVVGKVNDIFRGTSKSGEPHVYLNFGFWRTKCFTIVLWNEALQLLEAEGKQPDQYLGQWICVSGMLTNYERRPQIAVFSPTDIQLLPEESEAKALLAHARASGFPATPHRPIVKKPIRTADLTRPAPGHRIVAMREDNPLPKSPLDQSAEVRSRLDKLYSQAKLSPKSGSSS